MPFKLIKYTAKKSLNFNNFMEEVSPHLSYTYYVNNRRIELESKIINYYENESTHKFSRV